MQSLEDIPAYFADFMGINLGSAQIILSVVVLFTLLLPVMYLGKGSSRSIELVMLFLGECLLVGISWLPFWILIATIAVMAVAIALLGTRIVTGDG